MPHSLRIRRSLWATLFTATTLGASGCTGVEPSPVEGAGGGGGSGGNAGVECDVESGAACWAIRAGDEQEQEGNDIAVDGEQNVLVAGWYVGALELEGCEVLPGDDGSEHSFAAKLSPEGKCVWSRRLSKLDPSDHLVPLDVDKEGDVFVAGSMAGGVVDASCAGDCGATYSYFMKLDGESGEPAWCKCFGEQYTFPNSVVVDDKGGVLLVGVTPGSLDFGCAPPVSSAGGFVAKFDAGGACIWNREFPNANLNDAVFTQDEDIFLTGDFQAPLPVQETCGELTPASPDGGSLLVMKLYSDGACQWRRGFPSMGSFGVGYAVARNAPGNVAVTGQFNGSLDLDGDHDLQTGPMVSDTFVLLLDAGGALLWSRQGHSDGYDYTRSIAFDSKGNVVIGGSFSNHTQWGDEPFTSAGNSDLFVAKLEPLSGATMWSKQFGNAGGASLMAAVVDRDDSILATGWFNGAIDFGVGPLMSAGGNDIFVTKLHP